jgi:hypothetical protein
MVTPQVKMMQTTAAPELTQPTQAQEQEEQEEQEEPAQDKPAMTGCYPLRQYDMTKVSAFDGDIFAQI